MTELHLHLETAARARKVAKIARRHDLPAAARGDTVVITMTASSARIEHGWRRLLEEHPEMRDLRLETCRDD